MRTDSGRNPALVFDHANLRCRGPYGLRSGVKEEVTK
jgi:hypothetical protein